MYQTLIGASELVQKLANPSWAIVDCRFLLADSERGRQDYLKAHISGAVYAHLNDDLSGEIISGKTGRHPLPSPEAFVHVLSTWGIDDTVQVVAYDDSNGSMAAARLWWMLRWMGHNAVAVLDGGWKGWQQAGYPETSGAESRPARTFTPQPRDDLVVTADDIIAHTQQSGFRVIDVRAAERYRGDQEPIDPVAGHIPGARNLPFTEMLEADGRFQPPERLRARFQQVLGNTSSEEAVFYCGSGVSAAHALLGLAQAGLGAGRLYAGSWSEWIIDPNHSTAKGDADAK